ncbi:MAG: hypothetical protein ABJH05_02910 [Fulvivirga sp.]
MKHSRALAILAALLTLISACQSDKKSNLTLLSDAIPSDIPVVFGEGIISTDNFEFAITFSPEMDEIFFTRRKPEEDNKIYTMQLTDGKWSEPKEVSFTPDIGWDFEPHIVPKGDRLYFGSLRPLPDSTKSSGLHQWYLEKTNNGWGQPTPIMAPIKDRFAMYLTSSENESLYFTSNNKEANEGEGIYYAVNENGRYPTIKRMGDEINTIGEMIAHPYIAPDESYLIYDGKSKSGYGKSDLYISFNQNGSWSEAINLGPEVNTDQTEMCPSVSPDGKYLFFHRGGDEAGDIYWVDFTDVKKSLNSN